MKARNMFRSLKVPAVWLVIFAFITFGIAVWWFIVVEPTVNYWLAWEQSWQFLLASGCLAAVVYGITRLPPSSPEGCLSIRVSQLLSMLALTIVGTVSIVKWIALEGLVNVSNLVKAVSTIILFAAAIASVLVTAYQVIREQKSKLVLPKG